MNSLGVVLILTIVLFVLLAFAYRFAVRRAEKTGIGTAEGFISGAILVRQNMFLLQRRSPKTDMKMDEAELPPLPTSSRSDSSGS
jgi:hypothetical protein